MATTGFFNVFIVKTVVKGHGSMLRPLFLIGVWRIKRKKRAWLRWLYKLLGGSKWKNYICESGYCIVFDLLEQCLNPVLWRSIKTCNIVTFYKFLIHLGMHHTTDHAILMRDALGLTSNQVYWWRLLLEEYRPKIVYIKGIYNTVAGAVSRLEYDPSINWTAESFQTTKVRNNSHQRQCWMMVSKIGPS